MEKYREICVNKHVLMFFGKENHIKMIKGPLARPKFVRFTTSHHFAEYSNWSSSYAHSSSCITNNP